uniref:Uncharacterized protein n=1 Tax=Anopheles coluzzii TaxID=1518534 RepID=A0A8W7PZX8_ANOCL
MKEVQVNGHQHVSNGNGTVSELEKHTNGTSNGYAGHNGLSNGTNGTTSNGCTSSKKQSVKCTCSKSELENGSDTNNNQGLETRSARTGHHFERRLPEVGERLDLGLLSDDACVQCTTCTF